MPTLIHPTAILDDHAQLGVDVELGPYVVVEAGVEIGDRCTVGPFTRISGPTTIGPGNRFVSHGSVGAQPHVHNWKDEPTRLEVGAGNTFHEFVSLHRGTVDGGGVTRVGDDGLYMCSVHIAHDCQVGSGVTMSRSATLGGHVELGDRVTVGGFAAVHQLCKIGTEAFIGGYTVVLKDCLPFMRTVGARPARCYGPNTIGLERNGFTVEQREVLKDAWRHLHNSKHTKARALELVRAEFGHHAEIQTLLNFVDASSRGVTWSRG